MFLDYIQGDFEYFGYANTFGNHLNDPPSPSEMSNSKPNLTGPIDENIEIDFTVSENEDQEEDQDLADQMNTSPRGLSK